MQGWGGVGWGRSCRVGWGGSCRDGVGGGVSCRGVVGHTGVEWVMQGCGGSCRGGVGHVGVGLGHAGVGVGHTGGGVGWGVSCISGVGQVM